MNYDQILHTFQLSILVWRGKVKSWNVCFAWNEL